MSQAQPTTEEVVHLISSLVNDADWNEERLAQIPDNMPELRQLCSQLLGIRQFASALSGGELNHISKERGFMMGTLKTLSANLRHLTWHLEGLAQGDYSQTDPYMGDFSRVFNSLSSDVSQKAQELNALIEKYKKLSYMDALTGLPNRRSFTESAVREITLALRLYRPTSLIVVDVDHFKQINDTFGHRIGDMVLQTLSRRLQETLRGEDMCGRIGGEEFAVLLRETKLEEARSIAERLRRVCAEQPFLVDDAALRVTVSLGVAEIALTDLHAAPTGQGVLGQAIHRADQALYRAKNLGRNRVCVDERPS